MKSKSAINITIIEHEGQQVCCDAEDKCLFMVTYRLGNRLIPSCNLDGTWVDGFPKELETKDSLVLPKQNCPLLNIQKKSVAIGKSSVINDIPPNREEVKKYAEEISLQDWEYFWSYYEANGWRVMCKNKLVQMKNWKQTMLGWKRRNVPRKINQFCQPTRRQDILIT